MAKTIKTYRITTFDKNGIKPNQEFIVRAYNQGDAQEKLKAHYYALLDRDITMITAGMAYISDDLRQISNEYYNYLVGESWGIADIMRIDGVAKTVSSQKTVESAAKNGQKTARRKRWTAAQKRAAKAAKAA